MKNRALSLVSIKRISFQLAVLATVFVAVGAIAERANAQDTNEGPGLNLSDPVREVSITAGGVSLYEIYPDGGTGTTNFMRSVLTLDTAIFKIYRNANGEALFLPARVSFTADASIQNAVIRNVDIPLVSLTRNIDDTSMRIKLELLKYHHLMLGNGTDPQRAINAIELLRVGVSSRERNDGKVHFIYDLQFTMIPVGYADTGRYINEINQQIDEPAEQMLPNQRKHSGILGGYTALIGIDISQYVKIIASYDLFNTRMQYNLNQPNSGSQAATALDFMEVNAGTVSTKLGLNVRMDRVLRLKSGPLTVGFELNRVAGGLAEHYNVPEFHSSGGHVLQDQTVTMKSVTLNWTPKFRKKR